MNLDCVRANSVGLGLGWVVIDRINGGIIAHDEYDDCCFAWMKAAQKLADALSDIERTIHNCHKQR